MEYYVALWNYSMGLCAEHNLKSWNVFEIRDGHIFDSEVASWIADKCTSLIDFGRSVPEVFRAVAYWGNLESKVSELYGIMLIFWKIPYSIFIGIVVLELAGTSLQF